MDHRDEFIYRTMYEIDSRRYDLYKDDLYKDDLKVFGNNAEEILLQVITTCTWAREYHEKSNQMLDPYLPYMLWAKSLLYDVWEVPTINDLATADYRDKCKERWKYLITLLQFQMDNNATVCIKGGPIRPMSALAKLVKDTANCVLPSGFRISWKHIV